MRREPAAHDPLVGGRKRALRGCRGKRIRRRRPRLHASGRQHGYGWTCREKVGGAADRAERISLQHGWALRGGWNGGVAWRVFERTQVPQREMPRSQSCALPRARSQIKSPTMMGLLTATCALSRGASMLHAGRGATRTSVARMATYATFKTSLGDFKAELYMDKVRASICAREAPCGGTLRGRSSRPRRDPPPRARWGSRWPPALICGAPVPPLCLHAASDHVEQLCRPREDWLLRWPVVPPRDQRCALAHIDARPAIPHRR